jgi:hypothetical protein
MDDGTGGAAVQGEILASRFRYPERLWIFAMVRAFAVIVSSVRSEAGTGFGVREALRF